MLVGLFCKFATASCMLYLLFPFFPDIFYYGLFFCGGGAGFVHSWGHINWASAHIIIRGMLLASFVSFFFSAISLIYPNIILSLLFNNIVRQN